MLGGQLGKTGFSNFQGWRAKAFPGRAVSQEALLPRRSSGWKGSAGLLSRDACTTQEGFLRLHREGGPQLLPGLVLCWGSLPYEVAPSTVRRLWFPKPSPSSGDPHLSSWVSPSEPQSFVTGPWTPLGTFPSFLLSVCPDLSPHQLRSKPGGKALPERKASASCPPGTDCPFLAHCGTHIVPVPREQGESHCGLL